MELISQIGIVNWWAILAATALAFLPGGALVWAILRRSLARGTGQNRG